jgi:hypothetical protein
MLKAIIYKTIILQGSDSWSHFERRIKITGAQENIWI